MITTIIILILVIATVIVAWRMLDTYDYPELFFAGVAAASVGILGLSFYWVTTAYMLSYADVDRDSISESVNQCQDVPEFHCAGVIETAIAFNRDLAYWKAQDERGGYFSVIVPDSLLDVQPVVLPKRGN